MGTTSCQNKKMYTRRIPSDKLSDVRCFLMKKASYSEPGIAHTVYIIFASLLPWRTSPCHLICPFLAPTTETALDKMDLVWSGFSVNLSGDDCVSLMTALQRTEPPFAVVSYSLTRSLIVLINIWNRKYFKWSPSTFCVSCQCWRHLRIGKFFSFPVFKKSAQSIYALISRYRLYSHCTFLTRTFHWVLWVRNFSFFPQQQTFCRQMTFRKWDRDKENKFKRCGRTCPPTSFNLQIFPIIPFPFPHPLSHFFVSIPSLLLSPPPQSQNFCMYWMSTKISNGRWNLFLLSRKKILPLYDLDS